jgi:cytochrome b561
MNETLDFVRASRERTARSRYAAPAQALHWLIAALIFTTVPIAWIMQSMAHGPGRDPYVFIHKSIGVTILFLMIARLLWRVFNPAPPLRMGAVLSWLAKCSHWALYAIFLAMPISGYIFSASDGHAVPFFGLFNLPRLPHNEGLVHAAILTHNLLRWPLYVLILGHIAATVWHVAWRRDGTLERMVPTQTRS